MLQMTWYSLLAFDVTVVPLPAGQSEVDDVLEGEVFDVAVEDTDGTDSTNDW